MYEIDDRKPIYLQIVDQTIQMMIDKSLRDGEQMISIRELATMLGINPATVSKAYKTLEDRGLIFTEKGKGTFVSFSKDSLDTEKEKAIRKFKTEVNNIKKIGVEKEDLIEIIEKIYNEEQEK